MKYLYNYSKIVFILTFFFVVEGINATEVSVKLTDVIKSNGIGDINLLKDVTASQLEAYRLNNNGMLIFGVDVNEAASGTEKSSSQAITIKTLVLNIELADGSTYAFSVFETETKATVAEVGSTDRYTYFTNIGDTGSNRITSSNSIQNVFDSTIRINVNLDLSTVAVATLNIVLLETNESLGDPEAFYDFSNGSEDLAILNQTDSAYLDDLAPGRDEAPLVELTYPDDSSDLDVSSTLVYPSVNDYYSIGYEDLYPSKGDYDFNDLIVAYKVSFHLNSSGKLVKISGDSFILSKGAAFNHDWRLKIDLPSSASGVFSCNISFPAAHEKSPIYISKNVSGGMNETIFENTQSLYPEFNTFIENRFHHSPRAEFSLTLDSAVPLTQVSNAPFDAYLFVHDTQFEIHREGFEPMANSYNVVAGQTSFIDESGFPFAMLVPTLWKFPYENRDLGEVYPSFIDYVLSSGTTNLDWFNYPNSEKSKSYTTQDYIWWEE